MATQENFQSISREAGADLSAGLFKFVAMASDGQVDLSGDGVRAIGVLQNTPNAAGVAAEIAFSGAVKVVAGATVAAGAAVGSGAAGVCITAATADVILGVALTGGASGTLIEVLLGGGGAIVPA